MKKLLIFAVACAAVCVSCNQQSKSTDDNRDSILIDSLRNANSLKETEMQDLLNTFSEIQAGFDSIDIEEEEVRMLRAKGEGNNNAQAIKDKIALIQRKLEENKTKISTLQGLLDKSSVEAGNMKDAIARFEKQLNEKSNEIESLRAQIIEKDNKIAELDDAVTTLKTENEEVKAQKEATEQIARNQDQQLNTAYYMYGTSKELKQVGVLSKGEVLQGAYNTNDFIKVDIRKLSVIPLNSKGADLLTSHPAGSYSLLKDSKGEYTLRITDPSKFWSSSKYLVIKVK